jgi:ribosome-associated protein
MSEGPEAPIPASPSEERLRDLPVRDDGIRLGQLLKLADLAATGSDAKGLLAQGAVEVNGQVETRRGRQLARGDQVRVGDQVTRLV